MSFKREKIKEFCSICNNDKGLIQISDFMVCENCMPAEFINDPMSISSKKIKFMLFDDPDYERVSGFNNHSLQTVPDALSSKFICSNDDYTLSDEINTQIKTAESIDIAVSFIFRSGLNLIYKSLSDISERCPMRVLTTSYTGSTEMEALHDLFRLKNSSVKMEFKTDRDRFHAKVYIFNRSNENGTLLIGSANISKSALTTG